jgi:hypothetical protein
LLLGRPLDFTLLPFDDRQQKISGDKSERPLIENRYSPYRLRREIHRIGDPAAGF